MIQRDNTVWVSSCLTDFSFSLVDVSSSEFAALSVFETANFLVLITLWADEASVVRELSCSI